ncbi:uncharacterized protein K489DRAFT_75951 [Dissoconium aciculare CBS 342.82]|uniref:Uncharacterized protein n=1 Tax=Dissoconium aciculare CBS 342.82 TaxID=1314786 RepID=A0A6J3LU60_9PEZI|nr:uncharacterized protein K489DRAFT_75951 [Dissoconium aciculare CBS 342.82]KAF1819173.1 hypothetical protein K489DRAFT_75951 [Dissoconium aciculare CBS 342.82]
MRKRGYFGAGVSTAMMMGTRLYTSTVVLNRTYSKSRPIRQPASQPAKSYCHHLPPLPKKSRGEKVKKERIRGKREFREGVIGDRRVVGEGVCLSPTKQNKQANKQSRYKSNVRLPHLSLSLSLSLPNPCGEGGEPGGRRGERRGRGKATRTTTTTAIQT